MVRRLVLGFLLILSWAHGANAWELSKSQAPLQTYWFPRVPYITGENVSGNQVVSGLDVKLVSAIFSKLGREIDFKRSSWEESLLDLEIGHIDFVMGAYKTSKREESAYFSEPYRREDTVLILNRSLKPFFDVSDSQTVLQNLSNAKLNLCIVRGYYYGEKVQAFITNPANQPQLRVEDSDQKCVTDLHQNRVAGIIIDRLVGETLIWHEGFQNETREFHEALFSAPIYVMFSKVTARPEDVEKFNHALREMKANDEYRRIISSYLFPELLTITTANIGFR